MHHFQFKRNRLYAEAVPVREIIEQFGTPCYIYSHATLTHHFKTFDQAFSKVPHLTCYAQKANSNLALLRLFAGLGGGTDIVSGGELYRALKAGIPAERIVYSGVGKTAEEIRYALKEKILLLNVESPEELKLVNEIAGQMKRKAPISIRVNPDIDPKTHPYISTGLKKNKFGINIRQSLEEYRLAQSLPHLQVIGVDCHIGSQLLETQPFLEAIQKLKGLISHLRSLKIEIQYLDLGGGLGITYNQEEPPHPREYARSIIGELGKMPFTLILEPGRVIVGNAGILVTRVLYVKKGEEKNFVVVDAGMNDLVRPSLYGAYHRILPLERTTRPEIQADVVGPICETGDFLARDRQMPRPEAGEFLAVMSAGAYGFTMASNYNSRLKPAEVMVQDDSVHLIRKRETYSQMTALERIPDFLK
jgi:diaminopimelate decarboxylase